MGTRMRRVFYVWMLGVTVVIIWSATTNRHLSSENRHRIGDVQSSRIASCQRTYKSFPEMFRPFFPSNQKKWTKEQKTNWAKLQDRALALAKKCERQISA